MKLVLCVLALAGCSRGYGVQWPDSSASAPLWVCTWDGPGKSLGCLDARAVIPLVIQHMSQQSVDELRLQGQGAHP